MAIPHDGGSPGMLQLRGCGMAQSGQDLLADLTPAQQEAVTHFEGPVLILAAAGSGKTRVITRRVAWLLQQGVRASSILAITFTNKAAREMRERVEKLVPGHRVMIRTFHSLGVTLLRQYADRFGIDGNFTIYDTDDRNRLIKNALEAGNFDNTNFTPERIGAAISKAKNQLLTPEQYASDHGDFFGRVTAKVYFAYQKKLRESNAMDFDDLLYWPAVTLRKDAELRAELDARFRFILIDEYQDTNLAQYEIAHHLSIDQRNLCVVGDPDQSIYRWRGADIANILDFEKHYPDARVVKLGDNFRSTKAILGAAGSLIEHNIRRKKKPLETANPTGEPVCVLTFDTGLDEADLVAARMRQAVDEGKWQYRDFAIFVRMNYLTRALESAFVKHGIPFQIVKGLAFFERKENKDVLAYLRLLVNSRDNLSFLRAVAEPARGVGKVSLEHLQNFADAHEMGLMAACGMAAQVPAIKGKALNGLKQFHQLITDLRGLGELPPHEIIDEVLERSGYRAMLKETGDEEDADRLANVEELITAAKQFHEEDPARTLGDFLEQITLSSDVDGWNETEDRVSVMTLHTSKGLEFPVVYILAVENGILPHARSLESHDDEEVEEERRLIFVGMTRAKKELNICHARARQFRGVDLYAIPSEFLRELPEQGIEHIDMSRHAGRSPSHDMFRVRKSDIDDHWSDTGIPETGPIVGTAAPSTASAYFVGQIVQHDSYGVGQITDLGGFGSLRKMKIRFALHGVKTFVVDKVKLKVVPKK
jgi:ATP-dependent DNA helicase UvrD/PcrA